MPISSSGHLVLVPWLLRWQNPGLAFDAMLHLGTLVAVVVYFRRDLWELVVGGVRSITERSLEGEPTRRLAWLVVLATLPAVCLGLVLEGLVEALFHAPMWVGVFLIFTGVLLAVSEKRGGRTRDVSQLSGVDALVIGLGQALAIAPGISRSGATISAGLWRGLQREGSARFSFLLSVPIILGAGLFAVKDLWGTSLLSDAPLILCCGFVSAAVSGFFSIKLLLAYLRTRRLYPFAVYCWVAGFLIVLLAAMAIR